MSDAVLRRTPNDKPRRHRYFEIDNDRRGLLISIPSRKIPFALPADYRGNDDLELDYSGVIDIKITRSSRLDPKPTSHDKRNESPAPDVDVPGNWSTIFHDWDVWDYVVALGLLLLIVGLVVPVFSNKRELAVFAPLGAAAVGLGAFRARQRNHAST